MRTEEGSVSEVTASRSSRERNITTEQNLQNCSSTSTHGIVAQSAELYSVKGYCCWMPLVISSTLIYPTSRLVNVVKLDECQPLEDYNYNYLGWRPDQTYESGIDVVISVIPVIQYVVMVDDLMKMKLERQGWFFNAGVRIAVSPSQGNLERGNYDSALHCQVVEWYRQ